MIVRMDGIVVKVRDNGRIINIKDAGGVADLAIAEIRHASRDDVDVQLARERGKARADGLRVFIARRGKVARGHEARVPCFGQDDNVGAVFPDSAAHERLRAVKVRFALQRAHIHLDHADLHGGVLQNRFDTVIIRKESLHCNAQQKEDGKCRPLVCKSVADFYPQGVCGIRKSAELLTAAQAPRTAQIN